MLLKLYRYLGVAHKQTYWLTLLMDGIMELLIAVLLNPFHPGWVVTESSLVLQVEN